VRFWFQKRCRLTVKRPSTDELQAPHFTTGALKVSSEQKKPRDAEEGRKPVRSSAGPTAGLGRARRCAPTSSPQSPSSKETDKFCLGTGHPRTIRTARLPAGCRRLSGDPGVRSVYASRARIAPEGKQPLRRAARPRPRSR